MSMFSFVVAVGGAEIGRAVIGRMDGRAFAAGRGSLAFVAELFVVEAMAARERARDAAAIVAEGVEVAG